MSLNAVRSNGQCTWKVKKRVQVEWMDIRVRADPWQKDGKSEKEGLEDGLIGFPDFMSFNMKSFQNVYCR